MKVSERVPAMTYALENIPSTIMDNSPMSPMQSHEKLSQDNGIRQDSGMTDRESVAGIEPHQNFILFSTTTTTLDISFSATTLTTLDIIYINPSSLNPPIF